MVMPKNEEEEEKMMGRMENGREREREKGEREKEVYVGSYDENCLI